MKYIVRFPQSDFWRPKDLRGIYIDNMQMVKKRLTSKSGFVFSIFEGEISSEDYLMLKLRGFDSRIRIRIDK